MLREVINVGDNLYYLPKTRRGEKYAITHEVKVLKVLEKRVRVISTSGNLFCPLPEDLSMSPLPEESQMLCHDLDDPLAGYAAKYSLLSAEIAARVSFTDYIECAKSLEQFPESVRRRPRE